MFILILVGIVLFLIHPIAGGIYTAITLFALTIGIVIKDEQKKNKTKK